MTDKEEATVSDVWTLPLADRWRLYRYTCVSFLSLPFFLISFLLGFSHFCPPCLLLDVFFFPTLLSSPKQPQSSIPSVYNYVL